MDLLVRDLDASTKDLLKRRAARHGRSQQAEAKAILESSLRSEQKSWVSRLRSASEAVGGIELEEPKRHAARELDGGEWL